MILNDIFIIIQRNVYHFGTWQSRFQRDMLVMDKIRQLLYYLEQEKQIRKGEDIFKFQTMNLHYNWWTKKIMKGSKMGLWNIYITDIWLGLAQGQFELSSDENRISSKLTNAILQSKN
jgi:hypothetical protein